MANLLKLMALDSEDLVALSAMAQDATVKPGTIAHDAATATLLVPMNRFAWEAKASRRWFFKRHERREAVLRLDKVRSIRSRGVDRGDGKAVLSLLSLTFQPHGDDAPEGTVTLTFSGDAVLEAEVECVEAQLTDMGSAWEARAKPRHTPGVGGS